MENTWSNASSTGAYWLVGKILGGLGNGKCVVAVREAFGFEIAAFKYYQTNYEELKRHYSQIVIVKTNNRFILPCNSRGEVTGLIVRDLTETQ